MLNLATHSLAAACVVIITQSVVLAKPLEDQPHPLVADLQRLGA